MATHNLLGSSPTLDGIKALISRFYGGSTITLGDSGTKDVYTVSNLRGIINGVSVVFHRGRYRFHSIGVT